MQVIELPIKHPELFESLGVAQPKVRPAADTAFGKGSTYNATCGPEWHCLLTVSRYTQLNVNVWPSRRLQCSWHTDSA